MQANGKTRVRGGGGEGEETVCNGREPVQGSHSQIIRAMCTCGEHSIKRQ